VALASGEHSLTECVFVGMVNVPPTAGDMRLIANDSTSENPKLDKIMTSVSTRYQHGPDPTSLYFNGTKLRLTWIPVEIRLITS